MRSITTSSVAERVPASSASDQEQRDTGLCDLTNPMGSAKAMMQQQSQGVQSQKENLTTPVGKRGGLATPMGERKVIHNRVEVRGTDLYL